MKRIINPWRRYFLCSLACAGKEAITRSTSSHSSELRGNDDSGKKAVRLIGLKGLGCPCVSHHWHTATGECTLAWNSRHRLVCNVLNKKYETS